MEAVRDYITATNRRVTFEYALMDGINDTPALARELAALLKPLRSPTGGAMCHVNLIPLNPVAESPYQPSTPEHAAAFQAHPRAKRHPGDSAHAPRDRHRRGLRAAQAQGGQRRKIKKTWLIAH